MANDIRVAEQNVSRTIAPEKRRSVAAHVVQDMVRFEPVPMEQPKVADTFDKMSRLERVVESACYTKERVLYTLSPGGFLREWWKMVVRMMLYVTPLTVVLWVAVIAARLAMMTAVYVTVTVVLLSFLVSIVRTKMNNRRTGDDE